MQNIKLEFSLSKNRKYTVHFGRMQWLEFKSKRFVKDYLRSYKKLLTDNIRLINNIHAQTFFLYRSFYFELDFKTCHNIDNINTSISERWYYVFKTFSEGNQNAFLFGNIEKIIMLNEDVLWTLKEYARVNKITTLTSQVNPIIKQLEVIEKAYFEDKATLKLNTSYQTKTKLFKLSNDKKDVG